MNHYFLGFLLCCIIGSWSCAPKALQSSTNTTPNIVLIFTDDQGWQDVGCFGSPDIKTPNLDQMAKEGVQFTNFYVAQPVCSASRAGLLTGCYPNRIGMHGALFPKAKKGLNHNEVTIAELLKTKGYATGAFGKWHLGDHPDYLPTKHGFDDFFGIPYSNDMWPLHPAQKQFQFDPLPLIEGTKSISEITDQSMLTTQITEKAVDFINKNKEKPFFLYVPHPQPHTPLYVSDKFKGKSKRGLYGDVIMEIDWSVGEILKALEINDIADDTWVIFLSDNGPWLNYGTHSGSALPLREGKGTNWEGGVRSPCIMRWKNGLPKGKKVENAAMTIDLLPTIAKIVGADLPTHPIDGKDILPILTAQKDAQNPHEAYYFYYHQNHLEAVLSGDWKLYFPHQYRSLNGKIGRNDGLPIPYEYNTLEKAELYNVKTDVSEKNNVAADYPKVVERLMLLGEKARKDMGDALRKEKGENLRKAGVAIWE